MSQFNEQSDKAGVALAIVGLVLAPLVSFFARHSSRTLYFAQMIVAWGMVFLEHSIRTTKEETLSNSLINSWLSFMPEFAGNWCRSEDQLCYSGRLLSTGIIWLSGAFLLLITIKLIACRKPEVSFLPFYNFYKGFFSWFFGPLVYYSTYEFTRQGQTESKNYLVPIVVLTVMLGIILADLIAHHMQDGQESNEDLGLSWMQFLTYISVAGVMVFAAINTGSEGYFFIGSYFFLFFFFYGEYYYRHILTRIDIVFAFIQHVLILVIFINFSVAFITSTFIVSNTVVYLFLGIVLAFEIIQLILMFARWIDKRSEDVPEPTGAVQKNIIIKVPRIPICPEGSFAGLHQNNSGVANEGTKLENEKELKP